MYSNEKNRLIWPNFEWIVPITMTTESETDFENTNPIAWSEARKKITLKKRIRGNEWYILSLKNSGNLVFRILL